MALIYYLLLIQTVNSGLKCLVNLYVETLLIFFLGLIFLSPHINLWHVQYVSESLLLFAVRTVLKTKMTLLSMLLNIDDDVNLPKNN